MTPTIRDAYLMGREHLAASGSAEAPIEAEVLLRHVLQLDRAALYAGWDHPISEVAWHQFQRVLAERGQGRPVPYIVGQREFMGLTFAVDERVMIPRPETEVLVEIVLDELKKREDGNAVTPTPAPRARGGAGEREGGSEIQDPGSKIQIVDVGTGSGCIAIALAHRCSHAKVYATDASPEAPEPARINAARHGGNGGAQVPPGALLTPPPSPPPGAPHAPATTPP